MSCEYADVVFGVDSWAEFKYPDMCGTYPKIVGWEQTQESKPWYTKTGRLEFYREEPEFIEYGENLPVYREPVDATPHVPSDAQHGEGPRDPPR
jgi:nitrate reductase alpha subunit